MKKIRGGGAWGLLTLGQGPVRWRRAAGPDEAGAALGLGQRSRERAQLLDLQARGTSRAFACTEEAEAGDEGLGGGRHDGVAGSGREGSEEDQPQWSSAVELLGLEVLLEAVDMV